MAHKLEEEEEEEEEEEQNLCSDHLPKLTTLLTPMFYHYDQI